MNETTLPSGQRIYDQCQELGRLSEEEEALTRVFLSKEQAQANPLVLGWMREAGMDTCYLDAIGNVVGRYEGTTPGLPCLLMGSHLDTVRNGGKYDGMQGVVAAIECVRTLHRRGKRLPFALVIVGFSDEEGVRYGATLLGSRAIAGTFDKALLDKQDHQHITMRQAMINFGLDPEKIDEAAFKPEDVLAYAELHIEQGPVLEAEGLPVGNVTAINGANRFVIDVKGMAGHAGTVPMNLRQDALTAAAECVLAIEARGRATPELVATVGVLECKPGATNVIPGDIQFMIDVRSPRDDERLAAVADIVAAIERICASRNVGVTISKVHEGHVAHSAEWLQAQIRAAIAAEDIPVRDLPSGAGHDGMAIIDLPTDICMLFVRCKGGISHNPLESITVEDADISARVFLRFIENFRPRRVPV
jgi:allantoate deiminase